MAITKLGSVKTTLSVAIDYILNPEKTENQKYVYCYGCTEDGKSAEQEFLAIREFGTGKGDVLAQHIKQSFKGQEVTPEQALEIGIKTAERLLKNQYQYIVATFLIILILKISVLLNGSKIVAVSLGKNSVK